MKAKFNRKQKERETELRVRMHQTAEQLNAWMANNRNEFGKYDETSPVYRQLFNRNERAKEVWEFYYLNGFDKPFLGHN